MLGERLNKILDSFPNSNFSRNLECFPENCLEGFSNSHSPQLCTLLSCPIVLHSECKVWCVCPVWEQSCLPGSSSDKKSSTLHCKQAGVTNHRQAPICRSKGLSKGAQLTALNKPGLSCAIWAVHRCKLCGKPGRSCPVGLGTSSRILRESPTVFDLSISFAVTYTLVGYFWVNLPDFHYFWVNFGHFWANFEHFLTAFISRFLVNWSDSQ